MNIPCLVIAYARGSNTIEVVRELHSQGIFRFYVALDGPRDREVESIQNNMVKKLENLSLELNCSISIWRRDQNLGVAVSVITAIDWFFSQEEFGMIIEDDLKISQDFTKFLLQNRNSTRKSTVMISGDRFFPNPRAAIYSKYPATWGWATWKNTWLDIREAIVNRPQIRFKLLLSPDYQFWLLGALRVYNRTVDTWDLPVALYMRNNSKFSLLPPVNLVSNIGADTFASHTFQDSFPIGIPVEFFENSRIISSNRVSKIYDMQLRKLIYGIKARHYLLGFQITFFMVKTIFQRDTLSAHIQRVSIPD